MREKGRKISVSADHIETIMFGRNIFGKFGKTSDEALKPETDLVHFQSSQLAFFEDAILER